jgi:hypothetical protein
MASGVLQQTLLDELPEGSAEAGDASVDADLLFSEYVAVFGAFGKRDGGAALESSINAGIPDVLMGAPFQLSYTPFADADADADADAGTVTPAPVLASLAESVAGGRALRDNEWAAFTVMAGPSMLDYIHVHARPMASLEVVVGSTFDSQVLTTGRAALVVALPLAVDGSVLGGAITCTFATSDPNIATVTGMGASAVLTPVAAGSVTVKATCRSVTGSATVTIETALDARSDAGGDDANPEVGADASVDDDGTSASDADSDAGDEG